MRFGDDLAVDDNAYGSGAVQRKPRSQTSIEGSRKEIANRFVDDAGAHPSRRLPGRIRQSTSGDTNPQVVVVAGIIVHKKMGNGSVAAGNGDGRGVGGAGGKGDVGSASARNSGSHRSNVVGVGAGKQGRELNERIAGFVGVVEVLRKLPRVLTSPIIIGA